MRSRIVPRTVAMILAICLTAPASAQRSSASRVQISDESDTGAVSNRQSTEHPPLQRAITLKLVGVPLEHALERIAREAGLTLGYTPEILPDGARVSVHAQNRPADEILREMLVGTALEIRPMGANRIILLRRQNATSRGEGSRSGSVTGRVTSSETGAGLAGASVRIEGSRRGTLTRSDGSYRLEGISAGTHTLVASLIGYTSESQIVSVTADEPAIADFNLTVSAVSLDQVVVTGTLTPTEVRAIPTPISIIGGAEVERRQVQRVDQLFRGAVPGVLAWDIGPTDYYSEVNVRGKNSMSLNYIKTYIDGIEVANPLFIAMIDPNSIDRMEVLRGPQGSTMYGSDAAGGVLQIFTKKGVAGRARPQLDVQVSGGVVESDYASEAVAVQDHSVSLRGGHAAATFNIGGGYSSRGDYVPESSQRSQSLFAGVRAEHGPLVLEMSGRHSDRRSGTPRNPLFEAAGYLPWSRPFDRTNEVRASTLGATLTLQQTPWWDHTLILGRDDRSSDVHGNGPRFTTPADTFVEVSLFGDTRASVRYHSTMRLQPSGQLASTLTVGVDHYRFSSHSYSTSTANQSNGSLGAVRIDGTRNEWGNTGYFAQSQFGIADALFFTAGARVENNDNFGDEYGLAFAPRAGVAYSRPLLGAAVKVRTSWGKSIRPPRPLHRQAALYPFAQIIPNPNIGPEEQVGWDAGIDVHLGNRGSIGVTRYSQRAIGLIDRVVDNSGTPPIWQFQNAGEILNEGWELESSLTFPHARLTGTYSIAESTVQSLSPSYTGALRVGDQSLRVPRRSGGLSMDADIGRGLIGFDLTYIGPFVETDWLAYYGFAYGGDEFRGSMRDYWMEYAPVTKVGARIEQSIGGFARAFLRAENLTNRQLGEHTNMTIGPGRTMALGVRVTY